MSIPYIGLLSNKSKMHGGLLKKNDSPSEEKNYPTIINGLLNDRLALGRERYGHGVIVDQDTTKFGTKENDWILMGLEELLDGLVYISASIIRENRKKTESDKNENNENNDNKDDNDELMKIINDRFTIINKTNSSELEEMLDDLIQLTTRMVKF